MDPGAWVSQNAPVVSVVDIARLRIVANVVEKDLRLVNVGDQAYVEVDAYPGRDLPRAHRPRLPGPRPGHAHRDDGSRDPQRATIASSQGCTRAWLLTIEERENALLVPKVAVVDVEGKRGVFVADAENKARFIPVKLGLEDPERMEILEGLKAGDTIITNGAGSLRVGDTLLLPGQSAGGPGGPRRPGAGTGGGPPSGQRGAGPGPNGSGGAGQPAGPRGQGQGPQ